MKNMNSVNLVKQTLGLVGAVVAGAVIALPAAAQVPMEPAVDAMEEEMVTPEAEADMVVPTEAVEMPEAETPVEAEAPAEAETPVEAEAPIESEATDEIAAVDGTIVDIAAASGAFDTLVAALTEAELAEVLAGEGPFTVFAPTDEAFAALPEGTLEQLLLPENREILIQILTYHVVPGTVTSDQLESGEVETVEGSTVNVMVGGEAVMINEANVVEADILASNGVIHVIDRVILPPALLQ
ncbi:fasciclin domain-containing protein [Egbenema bharatensis]|uniref:fasciclin domain-containing protein n=1 Tax=Egbenema bharatensis TaxID=3463334 RepID=UPI003A860714